MLLHLPLTPMPLMLTFLPPCWGTASLGTCWLVDLSQEPGIQRSSVHPLTQVGKGDGFPSQTLYSQEPHSESFSQIKSWGRREGGSEASSVKTVLLPSPMGSTALLASFQLCKWHT